MDRGRPAAAAARRPLANTVSVLAAVGAADRWAMTLTFALVGLCYIVTGIALRPAGPAGRLILAVGAAAGTLVTVNPQPAEGGSFSHAVWASAGFVALAVWPAGAWRRGSLVPWGLRPAVCLGAVAVLVVLLAWFCAEVVTGAGHAGLAELVLGLAQAVWPLAVVLSCRHPPGRRSATPRPRPDRSTWVGRIPAGKAHTGSPWPTACPPEAPLVRPDPVQDHHLRS